MTMVKLGLFAFSGCLLLGHLFQAIPAFRHGVGVILGVLFLIAVLGGSAGVAAMYMNHRTGMRRLDFAMGAAPAALVFLAVLGLVLIGVML